MKTQAKFMATDIAECAIFIALMVAAARINLPFQPVPLTFQTVISVLSGLLLGWKKGIICMTVYCFMGLVGLPVFAGGGGIAYIAKPSFGYILGFIVAAAVGGIVLGKGTPALPRYIIAALAAFLANYAIGIPYCIVVAKLAGSQNLTNLFITANLIYMPKDALLSIMAAFLAKSVLPVIRKHSRTRSKASR